MADLPEPTRSTYKMKRDCASGSMAAASSGPAELGASWRRRRPGGCAAAGSQARWAGGRRGWARRGCRALLAFLLQLCAPLPGRAHAFPPAASSAAGRHQAARACAFSEISYPGKMTFTHENRLLKIRLQRWESLCASSSSVVLISAGFVAL